MYEPIKKLGQNFLTDRTVAQRMVEKLNIAGGEDVIEIGPGLGVVTEILERLVLRVPFDLYAVEIDPRFIPKLESMFVSNPRVHIVHEDVLKFLPKFQSDQEVKVIGSLPFYITSPIVHEIIKMKNQPTEVLIMTQKEVAQKIADSTPDASYMSTFVQTFYDAHYAETIEKTKFNPEPQVDAAVIYLNKKTSEAFGGFIWTLELLEKYQGFLHKGFSNPRKMLNKVFKPEELETTGISPNLRPQNLDVKTWFELFKNICL